MVAGRMSVTETAKALGVNPQRVHQRIRDGSLPAERIGNQWVIEMDDVRRLRTHSAPGRPYSPKSAWDLLAVAAACPAASEISAPARSRARSRLRQLLDEVPSAEPAHILMLIRRALGNRAKRALFVASPRDLPDVRGDGRIHPSGVSLPESDIAAGDLVEGYVDREDLSGLVADYLLSPAPRAKARVILHVAPPADAHPAIRELDGIIRSSLAVIADLAEHDGVREQGVALRRLVALRDHLEHPSGAADA